MELTNFVLAYFISKNLALMTAFLCCSPGEISKLWSAAHRAGLRMNIHIDFNRLPQLAPYDIYREGIILDVRCPNANLVLQKASTSRAFNHRHTWLLLHNSSHNISIIERTLSDVAILPDADVIWVAADRISDVYRVEQAQPLKITQLDLYVNFSKNDLEEFWNSFPTTVRRRKNLDNIYLKAVTVISQPEYFKSWSDLTTRHLDTVQKLCFPLLNLIAEEMNFRFNLVQLDKFGVERNGSFDGLAGRMQRGAAEVGIVSMFMRADRWRVMHYSSETEQLRGLFIFRQPSQSAVSNMFLLPFTRGVWFASAGVLLLSAAVLLALSRRFASIDPTLQHITVLETFTFAVGIICQQGFPITPKLLSVRVVMYCLLLTSVFAFTSYSAKIVAILQSPSDAVQSIADLTDSPMRVGVQELSYKNVYFAESNEPATQKLYRQKLLPQGERAYLSVEEGIARVRAGVFAFQVEHSAGYDIISKTFEEHEKCGLKEVQAFKLPSLAVPLRKHSGYRELIASRLRWQREVGLLRRWRSIWVADRPRCSGASSVFVSAKLNDVVPAFHALAAGALLALAVLVGELVMSTGRTRKRAN